MNYSTKSITPLATITVVFILGILATFILKGNKRNNIPTMSSVPAFEMPVFTKADSIVEFSKTLLGTPYKFATSDSTGFDCSGFVYYVYSKFHIPITRSSYTMANEGSEIDTTRAGKGDLIFFKGTDLASSEVGHVGIITTKPGMPIHFIHASSGKSQGVVITPLTHGNYRQRFIKTKRFIFQ